MSARPAATARPAVAVGDGCADVDVVVVGAGGAGLAGAVAAASAGARVIVLEKLAGLHGTTSYAVGSIAAAGTRLQRRAGISDDAQAFDEDILLTHPSAREPEHLRRLLAREAGPTVAWLEDLGVVFVGPFPEWPNRVPRMHNAVPNGRSYLDVLSKGAFRRGVDIRFGAPVTGLLFEGNRVCGVRFRRDGTERLVRGRLGVVLATGDFSGAADLRRQFLPRATHSAIPINPDSTGDGHRILMAAGAEMKAMDGIFGPQLRFQPPERAPWIQKLPSWRWLCRIAGAVFTHGPRRMLAPVMRQLLIAHMSPSEALFEAGAVLVSRAGERMGAGRRPADDLAERTDCGYIVGDRAIADRFNVYPRFISTAPGVAFAYFSDYERGRPDLVHWAADGGSLARRLGMSGAALEKAAAGLKGPLFALGPLWAMMTVSEGGAAVDARLRVLDRQGTPIPGLHAAGGTGQGGLRLKGHGLHLAWALTSGRLAGEAVVADGRAGTSERKSADRV